MEKLNILVAGGGIGGITAALCLAKKGYRVQVLEQADSFAEIGAGIQLSPNCTRVLHDLGLENALAGVGFLPEATQFRHWRTGAVISESPLGRSVQDHYGAPYYHIHRGDLLQLLVDAAAVDSNIDLTLNAAVESFTQRADSVSVDTSAGVFSGDLLIGADGIRSAVRTGLWGDEQPRFTGNIAWRALVPTAKLPENRYLPMSTAWWGPRRHFVHYFVRRGEFLNCVCVVEKTGWEVESWTEPGSYRELKSDFTGWHPDIQMLIDSADPDSLYKWALFDRKPMARWGQGLVTLLGDACHPTLPFMAQGAAMAIEDGAVLAACLAAGDDIAPSLVRYEGLRRERTARIQEGSRRNATVFHLSGIKAWLRNRAVRAAGNRTMDRLFSYDPLNALDG